MCVGRRSVLEVRVLPPRRRSQFARKEKEGRKKEGFGDKMEGRGLTERGEATLGNRRLRFVFGDRVKVDVVGRGWVDERIFVETTKTPN